MKTEFANDIQRRSLGDLNSGAFFCKGCGMMPESDECTICKNLSKAPSRWPSLWDLLRTTEAIVVAIITIFVLATIYQLKGGF